jgi:hypothetical protein
MSATNAAPPGQMMLAFQGFVAWLAEARCSLALTTYQAGRLVFLGLKPDGGLRGHERLIEQCQGLWTDGDTLWASGKTMFPAEQARIIRLLVDRVDIGPGGADVRLKLEGLGSLARDLATPAELARAAA